ncbi:MAG: hypothetical protein QXK24_00275 [Ignisphaera sp.]|uniref:Prepilin peptidase n=1 Tax=Ignisphaera aggregans TaxID=334771 RepID=A0A7C4H8E9_9CREN
MIETLLIIFIKLFTMYTTIPFFILYLLVLSWYDIKYREINGNLIIVGIPIVIASLVVYVLINGIETLFTINILSSIVVSITLVITTYLLAKRGMMGFGDVLITFLSVLALLPYTVRLYGMIVPLIIIVLLFGITYIVIEIVMNIIHNTKRMKIFIEATTDCGLLEKIYYFLISRVFRSDEFRNVKFYFPIKYRGVKRFVAKVGIEPLVSSEPLDDLVLALKGIPFVVILLVGTILTTIWIVFQSC